MIISGGSNIYPREIEEVLLRHPDLVEASVVGRPASRMGRGGGGLCRGAPGAAVAAEALDRLCLDHIAASSARVTIASSTPCRRTITGRF